MKSILARWISSVRRAAFWARSGSVLPARRSCHHARGAQGLHVGVVVAQFAQQFVRVLEGLWSLDIGRQLLARRSAKPGWQEEDANEHKEILAAVAAREPDRAGELMDRHIALTQEHWSKEASTDDGDALFDTDGA